MPLLLREGIFVRSGFIYPGDGKFWNAGIAVFWWSSRAYSDAASVYALYFDASKVVSSNVSYHYYGFPLRCLSTVLDMEEYK